MPRRRPHYLYYDSPRPERDSRIAGTQLLAMAVLQKAVADATSADHSVRALYQVDAVAFLRGEDGALVFWIAVLGADERQVRGLIREALADGNGTGPRVETGENSPSLLGKLPMSVIDLAERRTC